MVMSTRWVVALVVTAGLLAGGLAAGQTSPLASLQTAAERTNYGATTRYDELVAFLKATAVAAPQLVRLQTLGVTREQRGIPLAVIGSDLPDGSAQTVRASNKLRVLVRAGVHGDEVDGTEAALMLIRDLAMGRRAEWMPSIVLLVMPVLDADGSERIAAANLGTINGPAAGVGQHANAQGMDIDTDNIALRTPEGAVFVKLLTDYDPQVTIDLHSGADACAGYALTYAPSLAPNTSDKLMSTLKNEWIPFITTNLKTKYALDSFYRGRVDGGGNGCGTPAPAPATGRGNVRAGTAGVARGRANAAAPATPAPADAGPASWTAIGPDAAITVNYIGLRNRLALIGSSYSRAPFADRVAATRHFLDEALVFAFGADARLRKTTADSDAELIVGRTQATTARTVAAGRLKILMKPAGSTPAETPVEMPVEMIDRLWFEGATDEIAAAEYYVPAELTTTITMLRAHGIQLRPVAQPARGVERFVGTPGTGMNGRFTGEWTRDAALSTPAGALVVRMNQPLARLAFTLLEPASDGSLAIVDEALRAGPAYPVLRKR